MINHIFLCVIFLSICNPAKCYWSYSTHPVQANHYLASDKNQKYFVSGSLYFTENNLNISASDLDNCTITKNIVTQKFDIFCLKDGKYKLVFNTTCSGCPTNFVFRVNNKPKSYYWLAETTKSNGFYNLKIRISSIENEIEILNGVNLNLMQFSKVLTNLFYSRGENPIFKTLLGKTYPEQVFYNTAELCWTVSFQSKELDIIPFIHITSKLDEAIFGQSVNDVFLFIEPNVMSLQNDQRVKLKSSGKISGRTLSHCCSMHIAVLATTDCIYFTQDNFVNTVNVTISSQLINSLSITDPVVTDIAVYKERILIVVQGKLLTAKLTEDLFNFELLVGVNGTLVQLIKGISLFSTCLMSPNLSQLHAWESNVIVLWSNNQVYFYNIYPNLPEYDNWMVEFDLPLEFQGIEIIFGVLGKLPGVVKLLSKMNNKLIIVSCLYKTKSTHCSQSEIPLQFPISEWANIEIKSTSIDNDFIIWSPSKIGFVRLNGDLFGWFSEVNSVRHISFNEDGTELLVSTNNNKLFYGSSSSRILTQIYNVPNLNHLTYKFNKLDVIEINWVNTGYLQRKVFPLYQEIYNSAQKSDLGTSICDNTYFVSNLNRNGGNVQNLENFDDKIEVNFTLVHPASINVEITFTENFNGLINSSNISLTHSTIKPIGKPVLTIQSQKTTIQSACPYPSKNCKTGVAGLGISALTEDGKTICSLPFSQVLYVNVTCPIGLHIRIRNESGHSCGGAFQQETQCELLMEKDTTIFFPIIDLYSFDDYLYTIHDDILFHEINNKSGFELQNKNLILKNCYLCSRLQDTSSSSQLILQTAESACPCKLEIYGTENWITNLTFENVLPEAGGPNNEFVFDVKVLGKSFCDLQTRFKLTLLSSPLVTFMLWEYIMVMVFVIISLVTLAISYHNYIQYMRITKAKLS